MSQGTPVKTKADYFQLPLILTPSIVVFPYVVTPLYLSQESCFFDSNDSNQKIFVTSFDSSLGTVCQILKIKTLPNNRIKIILQGLETAEILCKKSERGLDFVDVHKIKNNSEIFDSVDSKTPLFRSVLKSLESLRDFKKVFSPTLKSCLQNKTYPLDFDRIIAAHLQLSFHEKKSLLEITDNQKRLEKINDYLCRELEFYNENYRIFCQTKIEWQKISEGKTKDLFKEQKKNPHKKIFINDIPVDESIKKVLMQQYAKLTTLSSDSSEYNSLLSYFEHLKRVPWNNKISQSYHLKDVEKILSNCHYGLKEVKERILEYLSLRTLSKNNRGIVLCLVGPPGVGKTSLGESIAKALGKPFVRIALGGIKEEADIRGHRRTYVGSYPGKIMNALQMAGASDPVIMLDEIDKMPDSHKSGATGALLEVLDPQQNINFVDHYLNVPFDLSKVMFIANANSVENLNPQLKDRLEIIKVSGYTEEEKIKIVRKCLLPKILKDSGLDNVNFSYEKGFFNYLIQSYTRESGVRSLERVLKKISRKLARVFVQNEGKTIKNVSMTKKRAQKFLGTPLWHERRFFDSNESGVALALAYTQSGGAVLVIEAKVLQGLGMTLTGNMGSVMKESILAATGYLRSNGYESFQGKEVHIHMPEGSCYKEGPSAGLAILCSIQSALTNRPLSPKLAMTGEITLGGKVLAVGGIKEKILAASREGMEEIILPVSNRYEFNALPKEQQMLLKVHFVEKVEEALSLVFPRSVSEAKEILS